MPRTLIDEEEIQKRIRSLAKELAEVFRKEVTLVVVLKGSFVFAADLLRALGRLGVDPRVEFIQLRSYRGERKAGELELVGPLPEGPLGSVLLIDDIADTGHSLDAACKLIEPLSKSVRTCVLLDKPSGRSVDIQPDFVGFTVGDAFVVGYGLDDDEHQRQLAFIGTVT